MTRLRKEKNNKNTKDNVKITSSYEGNEICINISSEDFNKSLKIKYPDNLWNDLPKVLKDNLLNNIVFAYTAHLPFILKNKLHFEFNTGYPQVFSWATQAFTRLLPGYSYFYNSRKGTGITPSLKKILNTTFSFEQKVTQNINFKKLSNKFVVVPFTFGKDSLLTYNMVKLLGLTPILFWIHDPLSPYESKHKLELFKNLSKNKDEKIICVDSEMETLRDVDKGSYGWIIPLTTWALLSIPIAYNWKAKYIFFSNEKSCDLYFFDKSGYKVIPDYEQSSQAALEISILTQSLTNGNLHTTSILQGLDEIGIVSILKSIQTGNIFENLMSCGSSHEKDRDRWCCACSKCARIFLYLSANGIDPIKEAGFKESMFRKNKVHLFNSFGQSASGDLFDAFALNTEEQSLAFFICSLRKIKGYLVNEFKKTDKYDLIKKNYIPLIEKYFSYSENKLIPHFIKDKLIKYYKSTLKNVRKELEELYEN